MFAKIAAIVIIIQISTLFLYEIIKKFKNIGEPLNDTFTQHQEKIKAASECSKKLIFYEALLCAIVGSYLYYSQNDAIFNSFIK